MLKLKPGLSNNQDELNKNYPNRHKEIYSNCCSRCPNDINKYSDYVDEESEYLKQNWSKDSICIDGLFVCFMRQKKICKGIVDFYNINENDIKQAHENLEKFKIDNPNWEKEYKDNYDKLLREARERIK